MRPRLKIALPLAGAMTLVACLPASALAAPPERPPHARPDQAERTTPPAHAGPPPHSNGRVDAPGHERARKRGRPHQGKDNQVSQDYTWSNVEIAGGGFVPGIIYNQSEPGLVYARTDIGGAYRLDRTTDRWIPLNDDLGWDEWNRLGVLSLATDPVEPNRVYLATGMYTNEWDPHNGAILRSDDYGETWESTALPFKVGGNMPGRGIGERLQIDPQDNSVLYYGAEEGEGLWRSTDYGATWSEVQSFPNVGDFVPEPDSDNSYLRSNLGVLWTAFAADSSASGPTQTLFTAVADTDNILYRSDDAGATWQPVDGAPAGFLPHQGLIDPEHNVLYLATSDTAGPYDGADGEVWRYSITHGTWTEITPQDRPTGTDFGFAGLALDRTNPGTVMVTSQIHWWPDNLIFRSTDRGGTWDPLWDYSTDPQTGEQTINSRYTQSIEGVPWLTFGSEPTDPGPGVQPSPRVGWMMESLQINPFNPDEAMYGTGATIFRTENLLDWDNGERIHLESAAFGIEETAIQDLVAPAGDVELVSAMLDLGGFVHDDVSIVPQSFSGPYFGGGTSVDAAGLDQSVLVRAGTDGSGQQLAAVSRDQGDTWQSGATIAGAHGPGTVTVNADGDVVVWAPDGATPVRSEDDGATWQAVNSLPAGSRVESDRADGSLLYAYGDGEFYYSTDGGETFTAATRNGIPAASQLPSSGNIRFGAVPGAAGELWFAGGESGEDTTYGLWHSTDHGQTWAPAPGFDEADAVGYGKAAPGSSEPTIFVVGEHDGVRGVFRSTNGGSSWNRINDDQNQWGWIGAAIEGDPDVFGRVYVGTNGRGIIMGDSE